VGKVVRGRKVSAADGRNETVKSVVYQKRQHSKHQTPHKPRMLSLSAGPRSSGWDYRI
jgi:hypothetical protein